MSRSCGSPHHKIILQSDVGRKWVRYDRRMVQVNASWKALKLGIEYPQLGDRLVGTICQRFRHMRTRVEARTQHIDRGLASTTAFLSLHPQNKHQLRNHLGEFWHSWTELGRMVGARAAPAQAESGTQTRPPTALSVERYFILGTDAGSCGHDAAVGEVGTLAEEFRNCWA